MGTDELPKFRKVKSSAAYENPEALFYKLSGRAKSHGYLRGPQQDVLRAYATQNIATPDVAFELPTGTGKTTVGLVIAEWWLLQSRRVAILSLTNQLAGQILEESKKLKIDAADLRGDKNTRNASEEGRYRTRTALAVSTYSNLFNVNPVIRDADILIFDDAHGAEQYVSEMWTITASASKQKELYGSLLGALRPGFTDSQIRSILTKSAMGSVEIPDVHGHPECISNVVAILDASSENSVRFAWPLIQARISSCVFLASSHGISIRPLVPPTHTHNAFANATQRLYMSATLGGGSDLQRSYGVEKISIIRATSPQWGRRYIFVPGVYATREDSEKLAVSVWNGLSSRRALFLAPSDRQMESALKRLKPLMNPSPQLMGATDIGDTLDGFVKNTDVLLALAGRYDGLDLPDDQCRLLILSDSPAAVNSLERHLMERWKMGPVLPLRANIDETVLLVLITEQGENRNQCEEQRNIFGFSHGFACR